VEKVVDKLRRRNLRIVFEQIAHDKNQGTESIVVMNKPGQIIFVTVETQTKKRDSGTYIKDLVIG
jgi:hypothetical protein